MADAVVERRPPTRFFCHRCNIEFEDVLQDYICPYCASGFIEQLENDLEDSVPSSDNISDADMSNIDDSEEIQQGVTHPMLHDLAFLMSGGRLRARPETLLEQLVWAIGGDAAGAMTGGGTPFVLVGAPGDYVFGGEGLDAVVTQLLGQLENAGPPPLPRERIAAIPSEEVTEEHAVRNTSCSVCWENFETGEKVSRLECDHIFHTSCIEPWLNLHATCPICRRSLLPEEQPAEAADPTAAPASNTQPSARAVPRVLLRQLPSIARRLVTGLPTQTWDYSPDSGSSSTSMMSTGSSVTAGGVWAPRSNNSPDTSNSNSSLTTDANRTQSYNMDIDFD